MKLAENSSTNKPYRIFLKSTREWVEVSESFYQEYTRENDTYRHRMMDRGQCACPKSKFWLCDGDCLTCEFRCSGNMLSLDFEVKNQNDDDFSMRDSIPDEAPLVEDIVTDKLLLAQLLQRLRDIEPEADRIINLWLEGKSDRAIAEALGRPQRTFARRMQQFRNDCRKIRGY